MPSGSGSRGPRIHTSCAVVSARSPGGASRSSVTGRGGGRPLSPNPSPRRLPPPRPRGRWRGRRKDGGCASCAGGPGHSQPLIPHLDRDVVGCQRAPNTCRERQHTCSICAERLAAERALLRPLPSLRPAPAPTAVRTVDRLRTVRFGSARYSVPGAFIGTRVELLVSGGELFVRTAGSEIARHRLVGPGEMSLLDAHYGRAAARLPVRAIRPRTPARSRPSRWWAAPVRRCWRGERRDVRAAQAAVRSRKRVRQLAAEARLTT